MRVLVAGGSGVVGRRVLPLLVAAGHDVTATVRGPADGLAEAAHMAEAHGFRPAKDPHDFWRRG